MMSLCLQIIMYMQIPVSMSAICPNMMDILSLTRRKCSNQRFSAVRWSLNREIFITGRDHDLSLNRLISLGVFKFVKIRFDEKDTAKTNLNAYYYLTPTEKKSIRFEVSGLTQSDNANGGQVSVNWRNRNIFRGAELLTATAYVGYLRQNLGQGPIYQYHQIRYGSQSICSPDHRARTISDQ